MSRLTYPRSAQTITTRARMALGAYRAVPGPDAAHELDRALHDTWGYGSFACHNGEDTHRWTGIMQKAVDAELLLKPGTPDQPAQAAHAAIHVINDFERATGITPGTTPGALYTRAEAEQAANAAFDCLSTYINLDHWNDRRFVTRAFLAFLDDPNSPYPYKSHDPQDDDPDSGSHDPEDGDGDGEPGYADAAEAANQEQALKGLPADWQRAASRVID